MSITRENLAESASAAAEISKEAARRFVDQLLNEMSRAIVTNGRLAITNFGSFNTRQKAARVGRNPKRPSEAAEIPARRAVTFRPAPALRTSVNTQK